MVQFESGEIVRALVRFGAQKEDKWQNAEFRVINTAKTKIMVTHCGEQGTWVERHHVKKLEKMKPDVLEAWSKKNFDELVRIIRDGAPKLLLPTFFNPIETNPEECTITLYHGVTIQPAVVETTSISGFVEHPGWSVSVWKMIPATRSEPDDVCETIVGDARSNPQAMALVFKTVFNLHVNMLIESQSYENDVADDFSSRRCDE